MRLIVLDCYVYSKNSKNKTEAIESLRTPVHPPAHGIYCHGSAHWVN